MFSDLMHLFSCFKQGAPCTFGKGDFLTENQEIVTRCVEVERWAGFDLLAVSM